MILTKRPPVLPCILSSLSCHSILPRFAFFSHLLTSHPLSLLKKGSLYFLAFPDPSKALGQSALSSHSRKPGKPSPPKPCLSFTCSLSFPAAWHDPTAESPSFLLFEDGKRGNSMVVQWLGLGAFIVRTQVWPLIRELRSLKLGCVATGKKKGQINTRMSTFVIVVQSLSCVWLFMTLGLWHARLSSPSLSPGVVQTHVCWVSDAIQPSHPLSPPSPPAFNLSQH